MLNSNSPVIEGNEIKRFNGQGSTVPPAFNPPASFNNGSFSKLFGISVESGNFATVTNNNITQMATAVRFFNNSITKADVLCNYMVNNKRGVTIEKCDIGDQGNYSSPIDDQWQYYGTFQRQADIQGFNTPLPPPYKYWYVRDLTLPLGPDPSKIFPLLYYIPMLGNTSASFNCSNPCGTIIQCKQGNLLPIVQNQSPYNNLTLEEQFLSKQSVFDALREETALMQQGNAADTILQNFHDNILQTNTGKIRNTHENISSGNLLIAEQENNSISSATLLEENHKKVNEIYLRTWAVEDFKINNSDRTILESMAYQNPIDYGKAVYSARVMLDTIIDDFSPDIMARKSNSVANFEKIPEIISRNYRLNEKLHIFEEKI